MKLSWDEQGRTVHGGYSMVWIRNTKRKSVLYEVKSLVTGRILLRLEVF